MRGAWLKKRCINQLSDWIQFQDLASLHTTPGGLYASQDKGTRRAWRRALTSPMMFAQIIAAAGANRVTLDFRRIMRERWWKKRCFTPPRFYEPDGWSFYFSICVLAITGWVGHLRHQWNYNSWSIIFRRCWGKKVMDFRHYWVWSTKVLSYECLFELYTLGQVKWNNFLAPRLIIRFLLERCTRMRKSRLSLGIPIRFHLNNFFFF